MAGCFSVGVKNEGGKHVSAQDELPTGSLRHLKPRLGPDSISQVTIVEGWSTAGWNGLGTGGDGWGVEGVWMCARLRMFSLLLNRSVFLAVRPTVRPPRISLFLPQRFPKSLERMCVHANPRLKGPYVCECPCVAPLTFTHSDPFICGLAPR